MVQLHINHQFEVFPQIIQESCQNLHHLYLSMGLILKVSGFFFYNQNNHGSSGAYVTSIYCSLSMKTKHAQNTTQHAKIVDTLSLHLFFVWLEKLKLPQFEPQGWRCHYAGWYTRSGCPLYICESSLLIDFSSKLLILNLFHHLLHICYQILSHL